MRLEAGSVYGLPSTVLKESSVERPVKYASYPLGDRLVAVGRATHLEELDQTGRQGNYLFHNLIFERDAVDAMCDSPHHLIELIRAASLFINEYDEVQPLEPTVQVPLNVEAVDSAQFDGSGELADAFVSFLFSDQGEVLPALILGDSEDVLEFMAWAYQLLPHGLRWGVSFETYSFGSTRGEQRIVSLPEDQRFHVTHAPHSLAVTLASKEWQWRQKPKADPLWARIAHLEKTRDEHGKQILLSLIDLLARKIWDELPDTLFKCDSESARLFFERYKKDILKHVADTNDLALLRAVGEFVSVVDIRILAVNPGLLEAVGATGSKQLKNVVAHWLAGNEQGGLQRVALGDVEFLKLYLSAIDSRGGDRLVSTSRLFALLPQDYSIAVERALIKGLLVSAKYDSDDVRQKLAEGLRALPEREERDILAGRELIKYRLGSLKAFGRLCANHQDVVLENSFMIKNGLSALMAKNDFEGVARSLAALAVSTSSLLVQLNRALMEILKNEDQGARQRKLLAGLVIEQVAHQPSFLLDGAVLASKEIVEAKSGLFKWLGK